MIYAAAFFGFTFVVSLWVIRLCRPAERSDGSGPQPRRPLFYCERCEQQTAMRISSLTATVVVCGDHLQCGFRRCVRDELHPQNVRVFHDPGPTKEGQRT